MSNSQIVRRIFEDGWNREDFDFLDGATADRIPFHYHGETVEVTPGSLPERHIQSRRRVPSISPNGSSTG